jgi:hypothetical protein
VSEAEGWILAQPRNENGKVDILIVIAEGKKRGYCICPKPMRQMIDFTAEGNPGLLAKALTCTWCEQPETRASWEFWYGG